MNVLEACVSIGTTCSFECHFCDLPQEAQFKKNYKMDVRPKWVNDFLLIKPWLFFYGGDVLMDEHFWAQPLLRDSKYRAAITTTPLLISQLSPAQVKRVKLYYFLLLAGEQSEHNLIAGIDSYQAIWDQAHYLKSQGAWPVITFWLNKDNAEWLAEVCEKALNEKIFLEISLRPEILADGSGLERSYAGSTVDSIDYYAQKKHIYVSPLMKLNQKAHSKLGPNQSCLSGEAWPMMGEQPGLPGGQSYLDLLNRYFFWDRFINKVSKWYGN